MYRSNIRKETRDAFLWTAALEAPFWALYNMLPFILYKELQATPFQISLFIALKPMVSLLSIYWSHWVHKRHDRLRANIMMAVILEHLPFFFFPWFNNPWVVIAAAAFYMSLKRGILPAWMEVLKRELAPIERHKTFSYGSALSYLCSATLPFVIGPLMDRYAVAWQWLFPVAAFLGLIPLIWQYRIPTSIPQEVVETISLREQLVTPWQKAGELIRRRPDFARFQLGVMLGGTGLMIMQPALPTFFIDNLQMSYTNLAIALTFCKGIGFALSSPLWADWLNKSSIFRFFSHVAFLAAFFPLLLFAAQWETGFVYVAYLLYGIMQGGSELSWNLSGPIFAKEEDSSLYSSVNVLTVGLRGTFVPAIGSLLCVFFTAGPILGMGALLCLAASFQMQRYSERVVAYE